MSGGLIGGIVGAAIGFIIGGPAGAKYGYMVGSLLGSALDPPKGPSGPKLSDLTPQSSEYGRPIPIVYGTVGLAGNVIWAMDYVQHENTSGGGKGGGSSSTSYTYSANFAVAFCEGPKNISKIYAGADRRLIWDGAKIESGTVRIYSGNDTQTPDPLIESDKGVGHAPAYRGTCYAVFENFMLDKDGNSLPFLWAEVGDNTNTVTGGGGGSGTSSYSPGTVGTHWTSALRNADGTPPSVNSTYATYVAGTDTFWESVYSTGWSGTAPTGSIALIDRATSTVTGYTTGEPGIIALQPVLCGGYVLAHDPLGGSTVRIFNASTGAFVGDYTNATYNFYLITPADDGGAWVGGLRNSDNTGVYMHFAAGATTPDHTILNPNATYSPNCMAVNKTDHSLWAHDGLNMLRIDASTYIIAGQTFPVDPSTQGTPYDMVYNPANSLFYITIYSNESPYINWVMSYDPTSWTQVASTEYTESQYCNLLFLDVAAQILFVQTILGADQGRITSRDLSTLAINGTDYKSPGSAPGAYPTYTAYIGQMIPLVVPTTAGAAGTRSIYTSNSQNSDIFEIGTGWTPVGSGSGAVSTVTYNSPTLAAVITDLHTRSGLSSGVLDTSALDPTITVDGYVVAKQADVRSCIDALRPIYWFDAVESEAKVKVVPRGGAIALSIPEDDLAAYAGGGSPPDPLETARMMDTELPRVLTVGYMTRAAMYQHSTKYQRRYHGTTGDGTETAIDFSGVLTDTKGQSVADALLYSAWSNRITYKFQVDASKYARLEPTDLVSIRGNTMRLTKVTLEGRYLACEAMHENVNDYALVYAQHAVTDASAIVQTIATPPTTVTTL